MLPNDNRLTLVAAQGAGHIVQATCRFFALAAVIWFSLLKRVTA